MKSFFIFSEWEREHLGKIKSDVHIFSVIKLCDGHFSSKMRCNIGTSHLGTGYVANILSEAKSSGLKSSEKSWLCITVGLYAQLQNGFEAVSCL